MQSLPSFESLKSSPNGQMIRVHASDGTVIVSLGPSYGRWLSFGEIPRTMVDALVSTEDKRFYMHPGVDPLGMMRIVYVAYIRRGEGRRLQGASTITQQLARNIFLNSSYTAGRKVREAILALALERKFSKRQILELYLNKVYFGGGAYGVDAASRKFFNHPASSLSLAESAVIAGLVKAPSHYSPTADVEAARGRAGVVLDLMEENGAISRGERAAVDLDSVKMAPDKVQDSVRYFTDWVLPQLDNMVDEREQPLDVYTTIDLKLQRSAVDALRANAPSGLQGALVTLDRDGAVRAMVGGARLCELQLQPRHRRRAPAGIRLQAVRLPDRAGGRLHRPTPPSTTAPSPSTAGRRATTTASSPATSTCAPPSLTRSTPWPRRSAWMWASAISPAWRGAWASPRRSTPSPRWCWAAPPCTCST